MGDKRLKQIKLTEPGKLIIADVKEPQISKPDDVKIKVAYSAINMEDISFFKQDLNRLLWSSPVGTIGHEFSGVVVDAGPAAVENGFSQGTRVTGTIYKFCGTCFYCMDAKENHCYNIKMASGTMSEYIVWSASQLIKLPDRISLQCGCLSDTIGNALHAIDRSNLRVGNKTLIQGASALGLIILQLAKMRGATHITLFDYSEKNRELALKLGAELAVDPLNDIIPSAVSIIPDMLGYDIVIEVSSDYRLLALAPKMLVRQGTLLFSGTYGLTKLLPVTIAELYLKEAAIIPFYRSAYMLPRIKNIMDNLILEPLVHVCRLDEAEDAFRLAQENRYPKILLEFP